MGALDGATFPHIIKVQYVVDGNTYTKRKWIGAGNAVPAVGSKLTVLYCSTKPSKAIHRKSFWAIFGFLIIYSTVTL